MGNKGFRELIVWQKGKTLAVEIYKITNEGNFTRDFGFRDQIRRSVISIPSNIAEGDERDTDKDAVRFFFIAKGSLAELSTQFQIACEIGYLDRKVYDDFEIRFRELGKMLGSLIKARAKKT